MLLCLQSVVKFDFSFLLEQNLTLLGIDVRIRNVNSPKNQSVARALILRKSPPKIDAWPPVFHTDPFGIKFRPDANDLVDSCNGLMLFIHSSARSKKYVLWNPNTKEFVLIPSASLVFLLLLLQKVLMGKGIQIFQKSFPSPNPQVLPKNWTFIITLHQLLGGSNIKCNTSTRFMIMSSLLKRKTSFTCMESYIGQLDLTSFYGTPLKMTTLTSYVITLSFQMEIILVMVLLGGQDVSVHVQDMFNMQRDSKFQD